MIAYRYCPLCGTALHTKPIPDNGPERRVCSMCGFIQWGNAKTTASGIVVNSQGEVLFAKRAVNPFKGMWDIPGGFLEASEHPEAGVVRELFEETGLTVSITRLIGVYMDTYGLPPSEDTLNFYYECRVVAGEAQADDDAEAIAWFDVQDIPEPLAFDNAQQAMNDYRKSLLPSRLTKQVD